MDVGRYIDGRALRYDEASKRFDVAGSPVTPEQVIAYDRAGQLTWASEELRNWAYQYAANVDSGSASAPPKQQGWFTRLPTWAKVLFIIFYPVSIPYFLVVMWKDKKFTPAARIAISVGAAVFLLAAVSTTSPGGGVKTTTEAETPASTGSAPAAAPQSEAPPPEPAPDPVSEPEPQPEPAELGYASGMYKVGTDLPPGEYVLLSEGTSYFQVARNSTGEFDSIICNDNFSGRSIITVKRGQYITVTGARIVPIKKAPKPQPVGGLLPAGMYKVGSDIPPGEHKVIADGSAYVEVAKNSAHALESIVSNDNFEGERYVTVSRGQYLKLTGGSLRLK